MDPYLDPVSGVLRNRLGISDAVELARAEAALSASRLVDLERRRLPGSYDLDHLRAFHRYILGDVYDRAGALRTVSIAQGSVFCLPQHLAAYAADVFGRLAAADRLRGLNREQFIGQIAEFLGDVNAMHPFREGNDRTQRAFFSQLAHDAGHHIDWVRMDPERNNCGVWPGSTRRAGLTEWLGGGVQDRRRACSGAPRDPQTRKVA
jgi:cell filamentation protein